MELNLENDEISSRKFCENEILIWLNQIVVCMEQDRMIGSSRVVKYIYKVEFEQYQLLNKKLMAPILSFRNPPIFSSKSTP